MLKTSKVITFAIILAIVASAFVFSSSMDDSDAVSEKRGSGNSDTMSVSYFEVDGKWVADITFASKVSYSGSVDVIIGQKDVLGVPFSSTIRIDVGELSEKSYPVLITASDGTQIAECTLVVSTYYDVSVNASTGGTVTGGGSYASGKSATVNATNATNYAFTAWTENGTVVSTSASYSFTVNADRTLVATFTYSPTPTPDPPTPTTKYTITATAGNGGTISPSGSQSVNSGASKTFTVAANMGYNVDVVTVDGKAVTLTNGTYTFSNVTEDHTISATFKLLNTVTVKVTVSAGGSVSPNGNVNVTIGGSQEFTITPDSGKVVDKVIVDGKEVKVTNNKFTVEDVTKDLSISVSFKAVDDPSPPSNPWIYIVVIIVVILVIIAIAYFVMRNKQ